MHDDAAHGRVWRLHQRVQRTQFQAVFGIDRIGITDQAFDLCHRQRVGACGTGRARRRARRGGHTGHGFQRTGLIQPVVAAFDHRRPRRITALRGQAIQQVAQTIQPTRGHGFRLVRPDRAGQADLGRGNGLLIVMGRQADPPFGQQQTGFQAHLAVQPGVGRRGFGPCAVIQPAKDHQIGALHAGLERAPDHDVGMRRVAVADFALLQQGTHQIGVIRRRHLAPIGRVFGKIVHHLRRFFARVVLPQPVGLAWRGTVGDGIGQRHMQGDPFL